MRNRGKGIVPRNFRCVDQILLLTKRSNQKVVLVHPVSELLELLRKVAGILRRELISSVELEEMDACTLERVRIFTMGTAQAASGLQVCFFAAHHVQAWVTQGPLSWETHSSFPFSLQGPQ